MCGIVGYVGDEESLPVLIEGLRKLEYRGYDSAGVALISKDGKIEIVRSEGKIAVLEDRLKGQPVQGKIGIGHTRWATHGKPSDSNAHPHRSGPFVVVHNGIIENYADLKADLELEGYVFESETDTEVIVKLCEREFRSGLGHREAILSTLKKVRGSYAAVFLTEADTSRIFAARKESPLIVGVGENAHYLASDVPAILQHTRNVIYLEDGDFVTLSREGCSIETLDGVPVTREPHVIDWNPIMAEKAGYKHFMLKEIHEQPHALIDTFRSAIDYKSQCVNLDELNLGAEEIRRVDRIFLIACGTSYHACMVGKYLIEESCRIPVEVDLGSEFRYRKPILDGRSLMMVISQSGETADTRAALQEGIDKGAICRAIVNVVGSSLARMAGGVIYTHAGPEIGVASTKAFTAQIAALHLFSLYAASALGRLTPRELSAHMASLIQIPGKIEEVLSRNAQVVRWAKQYMHSRDFLYLGRGNLYPVALEGALKLKEISYIHAEGYAAGEMKHGPIALIDENMPVVVLLQKGPLYEKMLSNVQEVRARGGQVLAVVDGEPDEKIGPPEQQFVVPETTAGLGPLLYTIPLQLLAYHIAVLRGTDVDQPRNLAKSVTVE